MSPYASELAAARLDALRALIDALDAAEDPAEKRRCAVAILKAPDPREIDDSIELVDDEQDEPEDADDAQRTPSVSERDESPDNPRLSAPDNDAPSSSSVPSLAHKPPSRPHTTPNLAHAPADAPSLPLIHSNLPP